MSGYSLTQTQTKLLTCAAIIASGTLVSVALEGIPGMVTSVKSAIVATDIHKQLAHCLRHSPEILFDRDLIMLVGEAIAIVLASVAESNDLTAQNNINILKKLVKTAAKSWGEVQKLDPSQLLLPSGENQLLDDLGISEAELPAIFSSNPQEFASVRVLNLDDWKQIFDWLCSLNRVSLPEWRDRVAEKLYATFPSAFREVLIEDLAKGGKTFARMLLLLLDRIIAVTKELPDRYQEIHQQLQEVKANLAVPRQIFSYTKGLIKEKTKDFVGRQDVFKKITKFINDRPSGYFILEAEPGIGKSSIMAQFVRRTGCVHHFNLQSIGKNSTALFLEKVCTQLIEKYHLDYQILPIKAREDSTFLEQLLAEASQKLGEDKLIIAVDALDEVDLKSQKPNTNVLYLPTNLPRNVYFVMTQQPQPNKPLPFFVEAPQEVFILQANSESNKRDIKQSIQQKLAKNNALQDWIAAQNLSDREFVDRLAEKSEYNFMYLRYILSEIEKDATRNLEIDSLPTGLNQYYQQHWHWQRLDVDANSLTQIKIDTIYVLVEFGEPVSAQLIAHVLGESKAKVRQILQDWEQFLRQEKKDGQIFYSVYHASYRDFLHLQSTLAKSHLNLEDIENRIIDNLRQGLPNMCDIREWLASMSSDRLRVTLRKLPKGLAKQGDRETLYRLLTDFSFIEGKISHREFLPQDTIEDYEAALEAGILFAGEEAETLRLIQEAIRRSAQILEKDKTQLAGQLLGRLMDFDLPEIRELLNAVAQQRQATSWLRPLTPTLTPPGDAVLGTLTGHTDSVNAVALTPNSQTAVSASWDNTLKVWDLRSGKALKTLTGHTNSVTAVAITPDGKQAVSASRDRSLKVWDLRSGKALKTLVGHTDWVTDVAIAPDGKQAVSASWDRTLILWDLQSGQAVKTLVGHTNSVTAVAITPNGKQALSASEDRTLIIWDLRSGQPWKILTGHTNSVNAIAITPNGKQAVSASADYTLKVWDLQSGKAVKTLTGHTSLVNAVAITPNGKQAVSASADYTLKVWDLQSGKAVKTLTGHTDWVKAVALTPDGKQAVSVSKDKTLILWDLRSGQALKTLIGHTNWVNAVVLTPDGKQVVSGSWDHTLKVWDLKSGQALKTLIGHTNSVTAVALTPDGKQAVSASRDKMLILWDLSSGKVVKTLAGHTDWVTAVALTSDGKQAVSASHDRTLIVWDLQSGQPLHTLIGHSDSVYGVILTPNGKQAISVSSDRTLIVWDLQSGQAIKTLSGHKESVYSVTLAPDGKQAVSASGDKTLKVWDLPSGQAMKTLTGHNDSVYAVAISPDSKQAVSASWDKTLIIWDLSSGQAVKTLTGHTSWIYAVRFTPDGKQAISASDDRTLIVWDLQSGQAMKTLTGHNDSVYAIALTPDGKQAVSASYDRTLKVWDLASGNAICTFTADSYLECCAVANDGVTIVAGNVLGKVHFLQWQGMAENGFESEYTN